MVDEILDIIEKKISWLKLKSAKNAHKISNRRLLSRADELRLLSDWIKKQIEEREDQDG